MKNAPCFFSPLAGSAVLLVVLLAGCGKAGFAGTAAAAGSRATAETPSASDVEPAAGSGTALPSATPAPLTAADLPSLEGENPDVYAFLSLPNTTINYPVLQNATDDTFYLEHNFDGSLGRPGVIYSELWNAKDFSDFNTILYGHDMNDFTMFGTLEYFRDPTYFDAHRELTLTTDTEIRRYKLFAAVIYDDRYLPYSFDFTTDKGKQSYLDMLFGGRDINNITRDDLAVSTADELLTLSTCVSQRPSDRYLVVAKYMGNDG